jgi:hypothetical protein
MWKEEPEYQKAQAKMIAIGIVLLFIGGIVYSVLLLRFRQRVRQRLRWTGHGIDVGGIRHRVRRVRADFISELQSQPRSIYYRRGLLASARRVVGQLSYFRRRHAQSLTHNEAFSQQLRPS